MMHPACRKGGRPARFRWVVLLALAAYFHPQSLVEAATCLPSAAAVRKEQPNAWPTWTYGPKGERCWYSGKKPVFAKAPLQLVPSARKRVPHPKPSVVSELDDKTGAPVAQPWALEYRWAEVFRYVD
jgi:hypothetical protein